MDSWFTQAPLIQVITNKGLDVIGMVKQLKQRYQYEGEQLTLSELYRKAKLDMGKKDLLGCYPRQTWKWYSCQNRICPQSQQTQGMVGYFKHGYNA